MRSIIQKTTGKGPKINEVPRAPTKKFLSEFDRIFRKPARKDK